MPQQFGGPANKGVLTPGHSFPPLENHLLEEVCSHIEKRRPLRAPCFQSKQEQWTFLQGLTSKVNKSPSSTQKQPPFLLIRVGKTQTALPGPPQPQSPKTNKQREKKKKKATRSFDRQFVSLLLKSQSALRADTAAKMCEVVCGFVLELRI